MRERNAATVLDEYLVVQIQHRDPEAFRMLFGRWHPRLLRHASHYTRDLEAARDVVQEAWVSIAKDLVLLRDPGRFRPWAYRIVSNKARDWVRREQTRRRADHGAPTMRETLESRPPGVSDRLRRLREGLDALEPERRTILRWFYVEEMSVREIAVALSIPAGTVKSRLFHARNALRELLKEES